MKMQSFNGPRKPDAVLKSVNKSPLMCRLFGHRLDWDHSSVHPRKVVRKSRCKRKGCTHRRTVVVHR